MQSEFDDHIKKQIDEFKLSPSPQVWDLVEAQLPEKKRRRFIMWWWPLGIILLGFGIYELAGNNKKERNVILNKKTIKTDKTIVTDSTNDLVAIKTIKNYSSRNKIKYLPSLISNKVKTERPLNEKNIITDKKESQLKFIASGFLPIKNSSNKSISTIKKQVDKNEFIEKDSILNTDKNITEDIKIDSEIIVIKNDSSLNKSVKKEIVLNKKDSILNKKLAAKHDLIQQKTTWKLTANIGRSNTVGKVFSTNNSMLYDASGNFATAPNSGLNVGNLYLPTAGISFGFDLQRTKQITNKLAWYGSFGYQYLSNHQLSGIFIDSAKVVGGTASNNFSQAITSKNDKVASYYKYGNNLTHINYANVLNLSIGLKYSISKHFSVYGGATIGYQIYSHWLQPDTKQGILYYSNKLTNKWNIGTKTGFDWQFDKQFAIGVFYNYNFNNPSLASVQQNLHWQNVGITFSIQLPFKNK